MRTLDEGGKDGSPSSAIQAIARKQEQSGFELMASGYLYEKRLLILSSIMGVPGYAQVEIGKPTVLPIDVSDDELGRAICDHLIQHDHRPPDNLRDRKHSNWPAYRASGSRSVAHFEANTWRANMATTGRGLRIEVAPTKTLRPELGVHATVKLLYTDIGGRVRTCFDAGMALREAGKI